METRLGYQPSFGMAMKFGKGGAARLADAFYDKPKMAVDYVKKANSLPDVDLYISDSKIEVKPLKFADALKNFAKEKMDEILFGRHICSREGVVHIPGRPTLPIDTGYIPGRRFPTFEEEQLRNNLEIAQAMQKEIKELSLADKTKTKQSFADYLESLANNCQ